MPQYVGGREGVTPVAGDVLLAGTTAADESSELLEITVQGEAAASGINRMAVRRSTTNGATPTAQTAAKRSPLQQAAYTAFATTFGTQPTTAAAPAIWHRALNAFGGLLQWIQNKGSGLLVLGATAGNSEWSIESTTGTNVVSLECVVEEA